MMGRSTSFLLPALTFKKILLTLTLADFAIDCWGASVYCSSLVFLIFTIGSCRSVSGLRNSFGRLCLDYRRAFQALWKLRQVLYFYSLVTVKNFGRAESSFFGAYDNRLSLVLTTWISLSARHVTGILHVLTDAFSADRAASSHGLDLVAQSVVFAVGALVHTRSSHLEVDALSILWCNLGSLYFSSPCPCWKSYQNN